MFIYTTDIIECQTLLPGLGKTKMAIEEIIKYYNSNMNLRIIYSAPTVILLNQVKKDLIKKGVKNKDIVVINSYDSDKSIKKQIIESKIDTRTNIIILITHISYLNFYHYFTNIDIKIFDEEMDSAFEVFNPKMTIEEERGLFDKFIDFEEVKENPKISKLFLKKGHPEIIKKGLSYTSMNRYFYQFLENDTFDLYAISNTLVDYYDKKRDDIVYFKIAKPKVFESNIKTYYLGYDVHNSTSSIIMSIINDIEFVESNEFKDKAIRKEYSNDFDIDYFFKGIIGNRTLKYSDHDYIKEIKELVKKDNLMNDSLYVWQFDKDEQFKSYLSNKNSIEIPPKSHGLNDPNWMTYNKVVIAANYKITPLEKLVCDTLEICPDKFIEARHINMIIQIMTRCEVRDSDFPKIKIIVSDQNTAERIANRLQNPNNKIKVNHLGLEKKCRSESKKPTISPPKEKVRSKINYLKKKKELSSKEKIKLLQLQDEYKKLLIK